MVDLKPKLDAITRDTSDIELHALCLRARTRIAELEAQLAERVVELREARKAISSTHRRGVKHENCEITNCPICDGGLFQCADCGAAEIETEQMVCTGLTLEAIPPAPKVTEDKGLTYGQKLIAEAIASHFGERGQNYDEFEGDTTVDDVWDAFASLSGDAS